MAAEEGIPWDPVVCSLEVNEPNDIPPQITATDQKKVRIAILVISNVVRLHFGLVPMIGIVGKITRATERISDRLSVDGEGSP